jgi:hypothetical protein
MSRIASPSCAGGLLAAVEATVGALCDGTDAACLTGPDALDALARITVAVRQLTAVQTALAVRVVESNRWQGRGSPTAQVWLAKELGCPIGEAHRRLATAKHLHDLPVTRHAVESGQISRDEADAIVSAAVVDPGSESVLLALAVADHDLGSTRKAADKVRHQSRSAEQEQARLERIRRGRRWNEYTDSEDGAAGVKAAFVPAEFAEAKVVLDAFTNQVFAAARSAGSRDSAAAYRADGFLAAMAAAGTTLGITPTAMAHADATTSTATTAGAAITARTDRDAGREPIHGSVDPRTGDRTDEPFPISAGEHSSGHTELGVAPDPLAEASVPVPVGKVDWDVVVLVDAIALQRGYAAPGETCTIPGVGDVSVHWAKQVLGDGVFEVLVHNGTDITTYATTTRHRPRPVELAVAVRDRACIVAGCHHDRHTEYDHRDNYADTKRTDYHNLGLLCVRHHDEKTHRGARLERIDDHWIWHPPPRPEPTDDPDPSAPNMSSDPTGPWRAPVGEHLTLWNLDHPPDPPRPHTQTTIHDCDGDCDGDGDGDQSNRGSPGRSDDPGPPARFGDAA